MKTFCASIIGLILILVSASCNAVKAQDISELDTLANLCIQTYSTPIGILNCNRLIRKSQQLGQSGFKYMCKGYTLKATSYIAMGLYDKVIQLCDSIEAHTDLKDVAPMQYNYIVSQKASAFLMNGQTELCIETMQSVYELAKKISQDSNVDADTRLESLKLYVNALKIMGVASYVGQQYDQALAFFDNAISICREHPTELYTNFMDITYCRFSNMSQVAATHGNDELKEYIARFEQDIKDFIKYAQNNRSSEAIKKDVLYYKFAVKSSKLDIAISEHNINEAEKLMRSIDSLYAVSALVRMRDKDYYASKVEYYRMIGNYDKAIAFNDSVIKRYVEMGSYENEYHYTKLRLKLYSEAGIITEGADVVERLTVLADTIIKQNTTESVQKFSTEMDIDNIHRELLQSEKEKRVWMIVAFAAIILSVMNAVILFFVMRKK